MAENKLPEGPGWRIVAVRWLRRFTYFAVLVCLWLGLGYFGVIGNSVFQSGGMLIAILLFALALPLSIILRLDQLVVQYGIMDLKYALLVGIAYGYLNIALLGMLVGLWRDYRPRRPESAKSAPEKSAKAKLNGSAVGQDTKH